MKYNFKNAAVFPFGYEFFPIISGLSKKKVIDSSVKLVSPNGWGIVGMDAGRAFGRPDIGIKVTSDIENAILESDTFVAIPFKDTEEEETNKYVNGLIDESIDYAISINKKVIDLRNIEEEACWIANRFNAAIDNWEKVRVAVGDNSVFVGKYF